MNVKVFAIYDRKSDWFFSPIFTRFEQDAIRQFSQACATNSPGNSLFSHPGDFDLYSIGTFDDSTGALVPLDHPVHVISGTETHVSVGYGDSYEV